MNAFLSYTDKKAYPVLPPCQTQLLVSGLTDMKRFFHLLKVPLLLGVLLLSPAGWAIAQTGAVETDTVVVERRGLIPEDIPRRQVKNKVRAEALAEAVVQVVGSEIQVGEILNVEETDTELGEIFLKMVRLDAAGKAVDWETLEENIETREVSGIGEELYYYLKLRVVVAKEQGRPSGFKVGLKLNHKLFYDRGEPVDNDEVIATVNANQDAYLTIFSINEDTIQVLFPNKWMPDNFVKAFEDFEFPSADWRARGVRLRVKLPPDRAQSEELIFVAATEKNIPFAELTGELDGGELTTLQSTLKQLNRWLVNIPLDARAVDFEGYIIQRQE